MVVFFIHSWSWSTCRCFFLFFLASLLAFRLSLSSALGNLIGAKYCQRHKEQWLIKFFCLHWKKPLANNITYTTWTYKENPLHVVASWKMGLPIFKANPKLRSTASQNSAWDKKGCLGRHRFSANASYQRNLLRGGWSWTATVSSIDSVEHF